MFERHPLLEPSFKKPNQQALPTRWTSERLGSIATVTQGGKLGLTKESNYRSSGIPAFSAAGQDGFVARAEFDAEGVILSAIGANCGRCFYASGKWTTLANIQAVLPQKEKLIARYFFYRSNIPDYWPRSGSAQPFVKPSDVKAAWVALPPIDEQRRIAAILDASEAAIQASEAVIEKLKLEKVGAIRAALTTIAAISEMTTVGSLFEIDAGLTLGPHRVPDLHPIPYLTVANVFRERLDLSGVSIMEASPSEQKRAAIEVDDLLLIEGHANPHEIGRCARATAAVAGMLFQNHLFRARSKAIPAVFSEQWFNGEVARSYWRQQSATSSGLYTINRTMLRSMPFPSVSPTSCQPVIDVAVKTQAVITAEVEQLSKLRLQHRGLLHDLLTGKVRTHA